MDKISDCWRDRKRTADRRRASERSELSLFLPQCFVDLECITTLMSHGTVVDKASVFPSWNSELHLLAPQISNADGVKTRVAGSLDSDLVRLVPLGETPVRL